MRVLYLSQYFPPEIGATQTRGFEMARGLVEAGHSVTVLTEFPNHPTGIIPPEHRRKLWERTELEGIDVLRVWVKPSPVKTFRARLTFYLSYMITATLAGAILARGKYDLIYATSPPLFVGAAALALIRIRRTPMVFEVRDLWPASAIQLGELRSQRAARMATWLEERCYERARGIVVVTEGIRRNLLERGIPADKVAVIPNGANTDLYSPRRPDLGLRERLGIGPDQFVAIFTGLHGLAQGLETLLEAAHSLRAHSDILFLLVGDGPRKQTLMRRAADLELPNVVFHDAVPDRELPRYLALADVGLHTSRRLPISRGALPVKMFSYMACGLPVLLAMEGEAERLLREANAGVTVPPEEPEALAEALLQLQAAPELRTDLGQRGLEYVRASYSRQELAKRLATWLGELDLEAPSGSRKTLHRS